MIEKIEWNITARGRKPDGSDVTFSLPVKRGQLTLDESWSPYVQAELEGALEVISDPNGVANSFWPVDFYLDPTVRTHYVDIVASQTGTAPGETMSRPFTTQIGERSIDPAAHTFNLKTNSAETILLRDFHIGTGPITPGPFQFMYQLVNYVLGRSGQHLTNISGPAQLIGTNSELRPWAPGVSAWDYIMTQVRESNLKLWCDEYSQWWLRDARPLEDVGVFLSDDTNIVGGDFTATLEGGYYTGVQLEYRWTDSAGNQRVGYGVAENTPAGSPARFYTQTINAPYPGNNQAIVVLREKIRERYTHTLRAVIDLRVTPGQRIKVGRSYGGEPVNGWAYEYVQAVTFDFETDEMTVRLRYW
jgi:hypothetical protein